MNEYTLPHPTCAKLEIRGDYLTSPFNYTTMKTLSRQFSLGDFRRIIYPQAGLFVPFPRCKKGCIARYAPLFTPCSEQKSCAYG